MNGEVAFVIEWDDEEGEARLSLDDGEREIVVPAVGARDVRPRLGADRAPLSGLAVPRRRRPLVDGVRMMLSRALLYTAVTRAQRLCVLVGERKAVAMALARSRAAAQALRARRADRRRRAPQLIVEA